MKIGLFFGTFNPIHNGHLMIANYFSEFSNLDKIWLVVSPHNPLKDKKSLLNDKQRLYMTQLAVEDDSKLEVSTIEFHLPQPSYTIDTLTYLKEKHEHEFVLIMGSDNLEHFHRWKNYKKILNHFLIYVYKRPGNEASKFQNIPQIKFFDVPLLNISATFLRQSIKDGKVMRHFFPEKVFKYIDEMNLYKK